MATEIKDYSEEYRRKSGPPYFSFRKLSFAVSLNLLFDYWLDVVVCFERYMSEYLETVVSSISNCFISVTDRLSCEVTVYFSHLMRELHHHCSKKAT